MTPLRSAAAFVTVESPVSGVEMSPILAFILFTVPAQAEPPSPIVELASPCVRTKAGQLACWGDAGGGLSLVTVAEDIDRLVHMGWGACGRGASGWICPGSDRPPWFAEHDVVDADAALALLADGRVLGEHSGEIGKVPGGRSIVSMDCADGVTGWAVLDQAGVLHAEPRCGWNRPLPWSGVRAISGAGRSLCALHEDGRVRCVIADGTINHVGRWTDEDGWLPVSEATAVSMTALSGCVLLADGTAWCLGSVLEDSGGGDAPTGLVPGLSGLTALKVLRRGGHHALCVVEDRRRVRCAGLGSATSFRLHPLEVPGVTGAVEVASFHDGLCARSEDGRITCWGPYLKRFGTRRTLPRVLASDARALAAADGVYWLDASGDLVRDGQVGVRAAWGAEPAVLRAGRLFDPRMDSAPYGSGQYKRRWGSLVCALGGGRARCWYHDKDGPLKEVSLPAGDVVDVVTERSLCVLFRGGSASCATTTLDRWVPSSRWMRWMDRNGERELVVDAPPRLRAAARESLSFVGEDSMVLCEWRAKDGGSAVVTNDSTMVCNHRPLPDDLATLGSTVWWVDTDKRLWVEEGTSGDEPAIRGTGVESACPIGGYSFAWTGADGRVRVLVNTPHDGLTGELGLQGTWSILDWATPEAQAEEAPDRKRSRRRR